MRKKLVIGALLLCLGGTATAHATTNDFTFTFAHRVIGTKEFDLKNKYTKTTNLAHTYQYGTQDASDYTAKYRVDLDGNGWLNPNYEGKFKAADGYNHDQKYKKIEKNTYTVNVLAKTDSSHSGAVWIDGGGEIKYYTK